MARITPVLLTLATDGALELQVIARSVSTCPLADRVTAVACVLLPTVSDDWGAVTVTVATGTGVTVSVAEALLPSLDAVIVVVPTANVVIAPSLLTAATLGDVDDQVIARPVSVAPRSSRSTALAVVVAPSVSDGSASVIATVATSAGATAIGALPLFPSLVAVIVADPAATADTTPALFTEAMAGADDDQSTARPVSTAPTPDRSSAVAVAVEPTVICAGDIVTVTVDTPAFAGGGVGVGAVLPSPPPPPHAVITAIISTAIATRCIRLSVDCHHGAVIGRGDKVGEGSDKQRGRRLSAW
jgi:hypothetical protein